MNKRFLLTGGLLAVSVTACAFALAGCNVTPEEQVPEIKETVRYSEKTNPYAEVSWQEIKGIDNWSDKMLNAPVYYQFEGSYSEAYQGNYSRTYMYMNCYKDGSMHATYGNSNYYGYWTNVDNTGKENLILHILRINDGEYNNGIYKSVCEAVSSDFYEFSAPVYILDNGGRTVFINGYHYSPVESLTISNAPDKYIVGDAFSTAGMVVTVNRENGKSMAVDKDSYNHADCRIKFSGFDSSEKGEGKVTVKYINTEVEASYSYSVMGVQSVEFNVDEAVTEYYVGDKFDASGVTVTAKRDDDGEVEVPYGRWKVEGFDSSRYTNGQTQTLTISFAGFKYEYDITVSPLDFVGEINGQQVIIKYLSTKTCGIYGLEGAPETGWRFGYQNVQLNDYGIVTLTYTSDSKMPEEEWNAFPKKFSVNLDTGTYNVAQVYTIPWDGDNRALNEPMPTIDGGTTYREIYILDDSTAIITYRYWYDNHRDTFTVTYTKEGNLITFTDCLKYSQEGSGANFGSLTKQWNLNDDDNTALRYYEPEEGTEEN